MNKLVYLVGLMCLLSGCGLFKTKKFYKSADVMSSREKDIRNEQRLLLIHDSLREDFVVEIVPVGVFSYSLTEGFKGSGSSIKMNGKKSGNTEVLEKTNLANINEALEKQTLTKSTAEMAVKREGFKLGIGFYCILVFLVLGFLLWFWWK